MAGCASSQGGFGPHIQASGLAIEVHGLGLLTSLPVCPPVVCELSKALDLVVGKLATITVMLEKFHFENGSFGLASTPVCCVLVLTV